MAITSGGYIIGNTLKFCPSGTTLASGVASLTNKPVTVTDDATYYDLPCADTADLTQTSQDKKLFCPNPGARVLTKVVSTDYEAQWKITLKEIDDVLFRLVCGVEDLEQASPLTPFEIPRREGWFRILQYDQTNTLIATWDFFGSLKVDGAVSFNNDFVTVTVMIDLNLAAANTVTVA